MLRILIFVFFISLCNWTLFNPTGMFPSSLLVAIFLMLTLFLKVSMRHELKFRATIEDLLMLLFLLVSFLSIFISLIGHNYNLNLNHLYAEISVVILYYFCIKFALSNVETSMVLKAVYISSVVIAMAGIIDYVLLTQGINIADILPMEQTNATSGAGIDSRARGLFVEPTDLAMAINAMFPVAIMYAFTMRNTKRLVFLILLYCFCLVISRSAAAIAGLVLGFSMAFFVGIIKRDINFITAIKYLLVPFVVLTLFFTIVNIYYFDFISGILLKLSLSGDSASAVNRVNAALEMIELFMLPGANTFLGYGTGFLSGEFGYAGHNWYLSILVEKGIVGVLVILLLFLIIFIRLVRMKSTIKYGLMVSFIAVSLHYLTQTGFYYPFLWILLAMIQLKWTNPNNTNEISNSVGLSVPKGGVLSAN